MPYKGTKSPILPCKRRCGRQGTRPRQPSVTTLR